MKLHLPRNKVSWNYTFQKTKFRFLRCSKIKNITWTNNGFPFRAYQGLRIKKTNNRLRVVWFMKSKIRARRQAIWNYAIRVFSQPLLSAHDPFPPSHFNPIFSTHSQGYTNFPKNLQRALKSLWAIPERLSVWFCSTLHISITGLYSLNWRNDLSNSGPRRQLKYRRVADKHSTNLQLSLCLFRH
jgi:hypothetical protein